MTPDHDAMTADELELSMAQDEGKVAALLPGPQLLGPQLLGPQLEWEEQIPKINWITMQRDAGGDKSKDRLLYEHLLVIGATSLRHYQSRTGWQQ